MVGLLVEEEAPASAALIDVIEKFGDDGEPAHSAWSAHNGTSLSMFEALSQNPECARRFGAGMRFFTRGEGWDLKHLLAGFDWASVDCPGSVVIDVGGGQGSVSQFLARNTENLRFVVQDLPGVVEQGRERLPKELEGRVEFVTHDFFEPQIADDAVDVILLR
ncbi:MAG: hypothetical protein MMC23_010039 [Stictis urceolatum]|nr:hypothetical protein [Stictis urceolata]